MRHAPTPLAVPLAALALALAAAAFACQGPRAPRQTQLWADAAGDVASRELAALCTDAWELRMRMHPAWATWLGDPRYNGQLEDVSLAGRKERSEELARLLARARNISASQLEDQDRLTHRLLVVDLEQELELLALGIDEWNLDPSEGPQNELLSLAQVQPHDTPLERRQYIRRWSRMPQLLRQRMNGLERALRDGRVASRTAVLKTIAQVEALLATDVFESPLLAPALGGGRWVDLPAGGSVAKIARDELGDAREQGLLRTVNKHLQDGARLVSGTRVLIPSDEDPLPPAIRGDFLYDVLRIVQDDVYPAFTSYRQLLANRILPAARPDTQAGLVHVPGGEEAYRELVRHHTTLPLTPDEVHELGLAEVARVRAEIAALGERVLGASSFAEIQRKLRQDPAMHFTTREETLSYAREAVFRAQRTLPQYFGRLPRTACEVVPVPAHEERDTTIAYYRGPSADGARPGRYYVNTSAPTTRPRYEAAVLAYHEAVPGHHLQIALAQELEGLPLVRRHGGETAFVEGWALYTERLCDEMGLFDSDMDRLGMLSFDAWRACRLVVDTGIHAKGWSRQRAIDYLFENTLLAANNVTNEVDRYIGDPGQALAYKIGQREILALREEARAALGARFDLAEFHDRVLENGSLTLPILRERIEAWIESDGA